MNHTSPVRIRDAVAHGKKKSEFRRQAKRGSIAVDGGPVDVFHRQPGTPVGGVTCIEQPCNGGVIKIGKQLALPEETFAP